MMEMSPKCWRALEEGLCPGCGQAASDGGGERMLGYINRLHSGGDAQAKRIKKGLCGSLRHVKES